MNTKVADPKAYETRQFWAGVLAPIWVSGAVAAIVLPGIFVRAWVMTVLWRYYVIPLGLQPLPFAGAIGISLLFAVLRGDGYRIDDRPKVTQWMAPILGPLFLFLIGWALTFIL